MKAMILAAGRGERMRPLTDHLPKPMLAVGGKPLLVWHIERLKTAGITELVINHAWLGEKIEAYLGDGRLFGVSIAYSRETTALETAGGIATALPLLGDVPFAVVNGDVFCDIDFNTLLSYAKDIDGVSLQAQLVLVPNPAHHRVGDFSFGVDHVLQDKHDNTLSYTYAGIGVYHPRLFAQLSPHVPAKLAPILREAMGHRKIRGMLFEGRWEDVGTPERLALLDQELQQRV